MLFEVGMPNLVYGFIGMAECRIPFLGHLDFDL